jgi:beta-lactamase regulating signal transducer with metallopeptidase domain
MTSLIVSLTCALLGVLAASSMLPAQSHAVRRRVLLAGLVLLFCLPLVRWVIGSADLGLNLNLPAQEAESGSTASVSARAGSGWMTLVAACWLAGAVAMLVRLARRWSGMSTLVRESHDPVGSQAQMVHRALSGVRSRGFIPSVRVSSRVATACVALWKWRPVILLPEQAMGWRASTLRAVLRHEQEHARRGDIWWRLAGEAALALWWWHPLAHAVLRRWTEACEHVCDEAVLKSGVRPQTYARSLLALAGGAVPTSTPAMAFVGRSPSRLRKRVASILSDHDVGAVSSSWLACFTIGILAVIVVLATTVHLKKENTSRQALLQTEAQLRLDANPFPADE